MWRHLAVEKSKRRAKEEENQPGGGFAKSKHCFKEHFDTCLKKLPMELNVG
jgi:hypothetical protein